MPGTDPRKAQGFRFPGARLLGLILLVCGGVLAAVDLDKMESLALSRYGPEAANTVVDWRNAITSVQALSEKRKIDRINTFVNSRVSWVEDIENWGKNDYWATPLETIGRRAGDCEDFSILKYVTLLLAGVEVDKLRITYVKATRNGTEFAHMVLAYYPSPTAEPLILDNIMDTVWPASSRKDLEPVYGFNSNGLWLGGAVEPQVRDPASKLSRWRELLQRLAADGLG